jgi:hypothetical protein
MKLEILGQVFDKYAIIKFHENSACGDRVVPCGKKDGRTDVTKLTVAVRKFTNATALIKFELLQ